MDFQKIWEFYPKGMLEESAIATLQTHCDQEGRKTGKNLYVLHNIAERGGKRGETEFGTEGRS